MSWLAPKNLEDASRVIRGLALVVAKMASDSKLARRAAASDYQKALQHAADLLQQSADAAQQAAASAGQQTAATAAAAASPAEAPLGAANSAMNTPPSSSITTTAAERSNPATAAQHQPHHSSAAPIAPSFAVQGLTAQTAEVQPQWAASSGYSAAAETGQQWAPAADAAAEPPTATLAADVAGTSTRTSAESGASGAVSVAVADAAQMVSGAGVCEDAVAPGARLPSVHDDMVVEAIAGSSQRRGGLGQEAVSTAAEGLAAEGLAAEGLAAEGRPSGSPQAATAGPSQPHAQPQPLAPARKLRERRVPETPLGRALGFAGLGASLLMGSLSDNIGRALRGPGQEPTARGGGGGGGGGGGHFLTEANAERLANALCRMRGAALKIGQMLSIQDESVLPPQVQAALERVRAGADVMPRSQLEGVVVSELGADWQQQLSDFDWEPRAAASIGQVHTAVLRDGRRVAMKIQYPGVARSIESDVDNLMRLISVANVLPRGMYVENAAKVAKRELALECDYTYELACQQRYRRLIASDPVLAAHFHVPDVVPELSSARILTTEWVQGVPIDKVCELSQPVRDAVGSRLLELTLRELFEWHFMQTDPNWGNFLYDTENDKINLIDFGASKDYQEAFVMDYLRMVGSCAERDRQGVIDMSIKMGFLTGDESDVMMEAHTQAGFVVGVPFAAQGLYDFGSHGGMTSRVSELGAVMLKHRLTPPPQESYSLHRKLSGAFLACMKLKARVPCRDMFLRTYESRLGPFVPPRLAANGASLAAASAS